MVRCSASRGGTVAAAVQRAGMVQWCAVQRAGAVCGTFSRGGTVAVQQAGMVHGSLCMVHSTW